MTTIEPGAAAPFHVLFLCTGNSARSIMAEALLRQLGGGRFVVYSAGSHPAGTVDPDTLETVLSMGMSTAGLYSKSWDEFTGPGVAPFDFVFTVCDRAAAEPCPVLPGEPLRAHWGVADPAAFEGLPALRKAEFLRVAREIRRRVELFVNLPLQSLESLVLQANLDAIGQA